MLKIIIDDYIPYIKGALDGVAEVCYLPYKKITPEAVKSADALIVRTRTRCDEALLSGSKVKFIASATIGYDHIDAEFCRANGIAWTNAPGCNALSVAQYIASALSFWSVKRDKKLSDLTIGIVGVGAVGSKIAAVAEGFGMKVLLNDPPRADKESSDGFVSLDDVCEQADVITFHTLLNVAGKHKTFHLANISFFEKLKRKPLIINAARGEVIETPALLDALLNGRISDAILDCWENEPDIDEQLLSRTLIATPHIAGYSADGKANAATQSVQAVSRFFQLPLNYWQVGSIPAPLTIDAGKEMDFLSFFTKTYNIAHDSDMLKNIPGNFENYRSHYPFRREPKAYSENMDETFRNEFYHHFHVFSI